MNFRQLENQLTNEQNLLAETQGPKAPKAPKGRADEQARMMRSLANTIKECKNELAELRGNQGDFPRPRRFFAHLLPGWVFQVASHLICFALGGASTFHVVKWAQGAEGVW